MKTIRNVKAQLADRSKRMPADKSADRVRGELEAQLSKELAERIGITEQNVSLLKSGKVKGVRFETLEQICAVLDCQPGDILEYRPDAEAQHPPSKARA